MSTTTNLEDVNVMMRCANCGIKEDDDIQLKTCTACKSARYCGVKCQKEHRPKHKKACKQRAAELRDELLFKQPESTSFGDCPICCLPLPVDPLMSTNMECCSKIICNGCDYANTLRESERQLYPSCAFCRKPFPSSREEHMRNLMKRVDANNPVAMHHRGSLYNREGNYDGAFEILSRAAELGNIDAHSDIASLYLMGNGVEADQEKRIHHLEVAAIGGHPGARHVLGRVEWENERHERAVKHWIIAANFGCDKSIEMLKVVYANTEGILAKEDFASALRTYHSAVDATKSPQRDAAQAAIERGEH